MSGEFDENSRFFTPTYQEVTRNGLTILMDPEAPHWIATGSRGARLMRSLDGKKGFTEIVGNYCREERVDWTKGWLHCRTFIQEALRSGFISATPFHRAPYPGRSEVLQLDHLSDLWLHVTNACNLSCAHCLVNSSPSGLPGEGTAFWYRTIDQGRALGVTRFYITGGEPFLRADIFDLIDRILSPSAQTELIILTNAIPFRGEKLKRLAGYDPNRLKLQISLDGPTAAVNDPIRGKGSFDAAVRGIKEAVGLGFSPTLTTVVNRSNIAVLTEMVDLAASLGIRNIHLLLSHHRGRGVGSEALASPSPSALLEAFKKIRKATEQAGMTFDNLDSLRNKLMGRPGVKVDLSNAAYESLCVYADGQVYPSAALAGIPSLRMGNPTEQSLEQIWRTAPVADQIRNGTVQRKTKCKDCYLKYLCGG
ncbi:MAG: radical SAM protein, partial [Nitrospiria bacterium]